MKPNYFVIGAAKCGSTSLCAMLGQHPDVFMTEPKEPKFFSVPRVYAKGYGWYESLYDDANGKRMRGEGSASYSARALFPGVPSRIHDYAPDARFIYSVRHPLEKIASMWLETATWSREIWDIHLGHLSDKSKYAAIQPSFNKALIEARDVLVEPANYWRELEAYWRYFSKDQFLIVFFEDFKKDPQRVMRQCFSFLGVDDAVDISSTHLNPSAAKYLPRRSFGLVRSRPVLHGAYKVARAALPRPLRHMVSRRFLTRKVESRPQYEPETLDWLVELLEEDSRSLLEYCGRPTDFWEFSR